MQPTREVLASAQPFGFGPVSKLVQIAGYLDQTDICFIGEGGALRYAELNDRHFARVNPFDMADPVALREQARRFGAIISVMEPRLVYAAVREGKPAYFFDSLLDFWIAERNAEELASIVACIRDGNDVDALAAFESLSVHESMLVAHMLATESYAQAFPGVSKRIAQLWEQGIRHIHETGSMINMHEIECAKMQPRVKKRTLVANLGGFANPLLNLPEDSAYIDILVRWLMRFAERTTAFDEIVVCSGAFIHTRVVEVNGGRFRIGLLPHEELMGLLANDPVYLTPPGLTSIHEAVALSTVPMLLPAQHYGHVMNRNRLSDASFTSFSTSFDALGLTPDLEHDDFRGTRQLVEVATRLAAEPRLFELFADYMDLSLSRFMAVPPADVAAQVRELRDLLSGHPIGALLSSLEEDFGRGAS